MDHTNRPESRVTSPTVAWPRGTDLEDQGTDPQRGGQTYVRWDAGSIGGGTGGELDLALTRAYRNIDCRTALSQCVLSVLKSRGPGFRTSSGLLVSTAGSSPQSVDMSLSKAPEPTCSRSAGPAWPTRCPGVKRVAERVNAKQIPAKRFDWLTVCKARHISSPLTAFTISSDCLLPPLRDTHPSKEA